MMRNESAIRELERMKMSGSLNGAEYNAITVAIRNLKAIDKMWLELRNCRYNATTSEKEITTDKERDGIYKVLKIVDKYFQEKDEVE